MIPNHSREIRNLGTLLLDIGAQLMCAGANTARIRITINRISMAYGYSADVFITSRALKTPSTRWVSICQPSFSQMRWMMVRPQP